MEYITQRVNEACLSLHDLCITCVNENLRHYRVNFRDNHWRVYASFFAQRAGDSFVFTPPLEELRQYAKN